MKSRHLPRPSGVVCVCVCVCVCVRERERERERERIKIWWFVSTPSTPEWSCVCVCVYVCVLRFGGLSRHLPLASGVIDFEDYALYFSRQFLLPQPQTPHLKAQKKWGGE